MTKKTNNSSQQVVEIDLLQVASALWQHIISILLTGIIFGALLFGAISMIGINIQTVFPQVPSQVFSALPYIATIIALIFTPGNFRKRRSSAPAALTIPYDRENR